MTEHFSNEFNFKEWTEERLTQVEQGLKHGIDAHAPAQLGEAMRYAVLDGGKRLRPLLVLAAAEAINGHREAALRSACVVSGPMLPASGRRAPSASRRAVAWVA